MKIRIVKGDDWEGLYIDGELRHEMHKLSVLDVLMIVQYQQELNPSNLLGEVMITFADQDWLEEQGTLPVRLEDVKEAVF